jgi:hypothetical protein
VGIQAHVKPNGESDLASIAFHWDSETEILAGSIAELAAAARTACTVELEDSNGAVVSLDVAEGLLCGVEIVVWPASEVIPNIRAPDPIQNGSVFLPTAADDDLPVVEIDTALGCELAPDESVIHLMVGTKKAHHAVAVAKNFLVDLDADGSIAGLWLLNVPPFAAPEA